MKTSCDRIQFAEAPRTVRIVSANGEDSEELSKERELAAYERGYQDGERALSIQLVHQRAQLLEVQNGVLASLRSAIPQVVEESEQTLVALTFELVRKIVAESPITPEVIAATVHEALDDVKESGRCCVLLHPDDLALLQQIDGAQFGTTAGERVQFETSTGVSRGGCLVKTQFGTVDALRETKLELLRQALQKA